MGDTGLECFSQRGVIECAGRADGHDLRAGGALAPRLVHGNVHAPPDDLQHGPSLWRVRSVDDPFDTIDVSWQRAGHLPQCFQRQGPVGLITPCAEGLRVVVAVVCVPAVLVGTTGMCQRLSIQARTFFT